jgi:fructokinase
MSAKKYPFIAAGEILIDFMSGQPKASLAQSQTFSKNFGGAPANVAVNMKRLGVDSTIVSKVGSDGLGDFLVDYLKELDLDSTYVSRDPHWPTSMVVMTTGTATAEFIAYRQADTRVERSEIPDELLMGCDIFHTTAHGIARSPTRDAVLSAFEFAYKNGKITSFDPNYSDKFWPDRKDAMETLGKFCEVTKFMKPSADDCERIFGKASEEEWLKRWHDMGVENIMFTRGEHGAIYSNANGTRQEYPAIKVEKVADPTGAGDAFTAGFYATYLKTGDIDKAMNVGIKVATFTLEYTGACAPLKPVEHYY